jgi:2-dehydro-3-deoxygalactonokinase
VSGLFISGDWGTSSFRLRLVRRKSCAILAEVSAAAGIRTFADASDRQAACADFLGEQLLVLEAVANQPLGGTPVCLSGMITSSVGWWELPYAPVPFPLDGSGAVVKQVTVTRPDGACHPTLLCSGVRTADDVMRGEECEVLGLFAQPAYQALATQALVVLPGTHSKHVVVRDGALVDFRTYLTGELTELLASQSFLRHSVVLVTEQVYGEEIAEAFADGVRLAQELPITAALFRVRTRQLLTGAAREQNAAFLRGILIGGEVGGIADAHPETPILLCAGPRHADWYAAGFRALGLDDRVTVVPAEVAALTAVWGQGRVVAAHSK